MPTSKLFKKNRPVITGNPDTLRKRLNLFCSDNTNASDPFYVDGENIGTVAEVVAYVTAHAARNHPTTSSFADKYDFETIERNDPS